MRSAIITTPAISPPSTGQLIGGGGITSGVGAGAGAGGAGAGGAGGGGAGATTGAGPTTVKLALSPSTAIL